MVKLKEFEFLIDFCQYIKLYKVYVCDPDNFYLVYSGVWGYCSKYMSNEVIDMFVEDNVLNITIVIRDEN